MAKAKGNSQAPKQQSKPAKPTFTPEQLAEQERVKKLQQQAKEREAAAVAAKAAEAVKEKDAQRKWILQYAEDDSESEPEDEPSKVCVSHDHMDISHDHMHMHSESTWTVSRQHMDSNMSKHTCSC